MTSLENIAETLQIRSWLAMNGAMTATKRILTSDAASSMQELDAWTHLRDLIQPRRELVLPKANDR